MGGGLISICGNFDLELVKKTHTSPKEGLNIFNLQKKAIIFFPPFHTNPTWGNGWCWSLNLGPYGAHQTGSRITTTTPRMVMRKVSHSQTHSLIYPGADRRTDSSSGISRSVYNHSFSQKSLPVAGCGTSVWAHVELARQSKRLVVSPASRDKTPPNKNYALLHFVTSYFCWR